MNDYQLNALMVLLSATLSKELKISRELEILAEYADEEAKKRGFDNWPIAYMS